MAQKMRLTCIQQTDIQKIVEAFKLSNWTIKPYELFEQYLCEQDNNERVCWLAWDKTAFAGYVTLKWKSSYPPFLEHSIPEIVDLNVLPTFRKQGIGTALLDKAESLAARSASFIGIGVGLYQDYGAAQRLYIKRGYLPDGRGVTYNYKPTTPGHEYPLDDDFVLWFTKKLET
jgi:GNAT superfamily N-acetyltransferase